MVSIPCRRWCTEQFNCLPLYTLAIPFHHTQFKLPLHILRHNSCVMKNVVCTSLKFRHDKEECSVFTCNTRPSHWFYNSCGRYSWQKHVKIICVYVDSGMLSCICRILNWPKSKDFNQVFSLSLILVSTTLDVAWPTCRYCTAVGSLLYVDLQMDWASINLHITVDG